MNNKQNAIFSPSIPIGEKCKNIECDGILINCIELTKQECYKMCDKCCTRFDIKPVVEMLDDAIETIKVVLGETQDE